MEDTHLLKGKGTYFKCFILIEILGLGTLLKCFTLIEILELSTLSIETLLYALLSIQNNQYVNAL